MPTLVVIDFLCKTFCICAMKIHKTFCMCQGSLPQAGRTRVRPGTALSGRHRAGDPVNRRAYLPVVKLQERPLSGLPPASLMLVEMVAVYFVLAASVTFGFSVATWL